MSNSEQMYEYCLDDIPCEKKAYVPGHLFDKENKEKEKAFWPRYLLKPCASEREDKMKDCRDCVQWETCPCGKSGHKRGTSIGYSIGECKDYTERKSK